MSPGNMVQGCLILNRYLVVYQDGIDVPPPLLHTSHSKGGHHFDQKLYRIISRVRSESTARR